MSNIRTFIAVDVSPEVRSLARKQIDALTEAGVDYKWVDTAHMHLTLKFLGNIRDSEVPDVCKAVSDAVAKLPPISALVEGLGGFPSALRPRVVWLGIGAGDDELRELQRAVDQALEALGFPRERQDFVPHLTLGRLPSGMEIPAALKYALAAHEATCFGGFEVDQVVVYASYLERRGPIYTPMATIELDG